MKTKIYILLGLLVVVAAIVMLTGRSVKMISIGAVIPQTGFGAAWGESVMKGITMAKEDLEEEFGKDNVRIVIEDSQGSPTAAVSAVKKLLDLDQVDAIYSEFSGVSSAVSPVVMAAGKVFVYSAFNEQISRDNPMAVKTFASHEVACERFAEEFLDPSDKVLIVSVIPDAGPECIRGLRKVISDQNIKDIEGFQGTDFRTLFLQNKSFDADYLIPLMYEDGAYALIKQRGELGVQTKIFCYKEDCMTEKIVKETPPSYLKGNLYFSIPIDSTFEQKVRSRYTGISDGNMQGLANAYQSVMLLGRGLAACNDKTGACVSRKIGETNDASSFTYKNAKIVDRMLVSDVVIDEVR